jgi:hypothetical protein
MKYQIIISLILCLTRAGTSLGAIDSLMTRIIRIEKAVMEEADPIKKDSLLLEKGLLYKSRGDHSKCYTTLQRISFTTPDTTFLSRVTYEKTLSLLLLHDYDNALTESWEMEKYGIDRREEKVLYLMVLLENERWEDFKNTFAQQASAVNFSDTVGLEKHFTTLPLLDEEYYYRKSSFPGRGLIKTGYSRQGITNILLQTTFVAFTAYNVYTGFYFTGFFSGVQPTRRFYRGGRILTTSLVRKKNEGLIRAVKEKGYSYIFALYPF